MRRRDDERVQPDIPRPDVDRVHVPDGERPPASPPPRRRSGPVARVAANAAADPSRISRTSNSQSSPPLLARSTLAGRRRKSSREVPARRCRRPVSNRGSPSSSGRGSPPAASACSLRAWPRAHARTAASVRLQPALDDEALDLVDGVVGEPAPVDRREWLRGHYLVSRLVGRWPNGLTFREWAEPTIGRRPRQPSGSSPARIAAWCVQSDTICRIVRRGRGVDATSGLTRRVSRGRVVRSDQPSANMPSGSWWAMPR